ncbi:LegC family aminotransferase [Parahaliea mediterranea]|uniref:LegC family aminotransferase n=2 Tax=Parahaliea mediterranea TaxID=651086 RepID=A0A939IN65_9GAMM|nr:LegC family aminotransferase [Parahaliea mediterranea]
MQEIRRLYGAGPVPLHRPIFEGNERQYLVDCIDSNFVSSVGEKVAEFERKIADFVGADHAVATVNGTAALHVSLQLAGVEANTDVITQALTFVATCNAIKYLGASPVFIDVDRDTLGLSAIALSTFLEKHAERKNGQIINKFSGRRLAACLPMHTFGIPCRIADLKEVCEEWGIPVVEDAAESLGSTSRNQSGGWQHTGTFGELGVLSFNGNKVITTGGGGMIITNDASLAVRAKHLTTTAKSPHAYEFVHDELGYNYRMPNLNAALGCAQAERLPEMLKRKSEVADRYRKILTSSPLQFIEAPEGTRRNNWLNAVLLESREKRDEFLNNCNAEGVMVRPIWTLMNRLKMYRHCQHDGLENSQWLEDRVVNIPSSVPESSAVANNIQE